MNFTSLARRTHTALLALLLVVASFLPIFNFSSVSAYSLLGDREIRMGTSQAGVVDTDGYRVNFVLSEDITNLEGVVVTFCEQSPIIGDDACDVPTGFDLDGASVTNADAGDVNLNSFTAAFENVSTGGANDNTLILHNSTGVGAVNGNEVTFTIEDVTNPSDVGTFFARIMVYDGEARALAYNTDDDPAEIQSPDMAGGIALSTAEVITIEAKVQERLEFCIYTGTSTAWNQDDCSAPDDPVVLGDVNGVLDNVNPSINNDARFNITTNASAGATIRMKGDTLRSGPTFEIASIGGTATGSDEGTEQFGMCLYSDTDTLFDAASLTPSSPYNSGDCGDADSGQGPGNDNGATFAFDDNTTDGTLSPYGSIIATKAAGDWSTGVLVFLGNISTTTEPGIYTTTLDFIATGRY